MRESICPVCLNSPVEESHHLVPKAYGGAEDGPMVSLCSSCHKNAHFEAEALSAKHKKKVLVHYLSTQQLNRKITQEIIATIIRVKYHFNKETNPNVKRKVIVEVPQSTLTKMHKRKLDTGFSNMEQYILSLITKDITRL